VHRTAWCCCGALRARVSADPTLVAACHCEQCQRRTGSAFGISAYFRADQVQIDGASKTFSRPGQEGRAIQGHFCPECGTTLFWKAEFMPGHVGIAAGTFADPTFPPPTVSAWEQRKHPWVAFNHRLLRLQDQRPPLGLPFGLALLVLRLLGRGRLNQAVLLTVLHWIAARVTWLDEVRVGPALNGGNFRSDLPHRHRASNRGGRGYRGADRA
jgi:hypothetical protein